MVRVDATVAKSGVYKYTRSDGSVVREYLPPEEVVKADSLASLEDVTVTNRHPGNMVDPSTWGSVAIGHGRNGRSEAGNKAVATLVINRGDAQSKIGTELVEVSRGVQVRLEDTAGVTPQGEAYDAIQRDVVYNHIAVGPPGWGRQGPEVAMRLDAAGDEQVSCCPTCAEHTDAHLPWSECMAKAMKEYGTEAEAKKVCGAIKAKNDAALAAGVTTDSAQDHPMKYTDPKTKIVHDFKSDAELAEFIGAQRVETPAVSTAKLDAERDALKAERDALKAKVDAREVADQAASRANLETRAKAVLGAAHKFDSADTTRTIQLAALAKLTPAVKYDGQSDAYVAAAFDIAIAQAPATETSRSDAMAAALHGVGPGGLPVARTDATEPKLDAREAMIKRESEAWKKGRPVASN